MGSTSKALLLGRVEPVRIEAALKAAGVVQGEGQAKSMSGSYVYNVEHGGGVGSLWLHGPETSRYDDVDVYDGERTAVIAHPKHDAVLRALVEEFGGFLRAGGDDGDWTPVAGRNEIELGPKQNLLLLLQRIVPVAASHALVEALEADHGLGLDFVKAIEDLPKPETAYAPKP